MAEAAERESCLFLSEWEAARRENHAIRRKYTEGELCRQQLQLQSALTSIKSWLAVVETRQRLHQVAFNAAVQALDELDSRWRPLRLEPDAAPAAWLVASERHALQGLTKCWATAAPEGGQNLIQRFQTLSDHLSSQVVSAIRLWDESHQAAEQAWQNHHERVEEAARAIAQERAPPDSWLSEVQYRERARKHVTDQAAADELLLSTAQQLATLEAQRVEYWKSFAESYRSCCGQQGVVLQDEAPGMVSNSFQAPQMPVLPDMPTAFGAVLQRVSAAMMAPSGLFGRGSDWREGATLVLTIHGYLHLFLPDPKDPKGAKTAADGDDTPLELVEADVKASVYAPRATKCVFQRRGQELVLDLAEASADPGDGTGTASVGEASGSSTGWRKWFAKAEKTEPLRRIHAKMSDPQQFVELENHGHNFVRRGQALRSASGSPTAGYGAKNSS